MKVHVVIIIREEGSVFADLVKAWQIAQETNVSQVDKPGFAALSKYCILFICKKGRVQSTSFPPALKELANMKEVSVAAFPNGEGGEGLCSSMLRALV